MYVVQLKSTYREQTLPTLCHNNIQEILLLSEKQKNTKQQKKTN